MPGKARECRSRRTASVPSEKNSQRGEDSPAKEKGWLRFVRDAATTYQVTPAHIPCILMTEL